MRTRSYLGVGVAAAAAVMVLAALYAPRGAQVGSAASSGVLPPGVIAPQCVTPVSFSARNFPSTPRINNRLMPLVPGRQFVLEGTANRGPGTLPHQVIFTVTNLTKEINGVRTVVVWDQDVNDGVISESELAFFAQDRSGNVWNLGEYPEIYEEGQFVGAPDTWIAGEEGAKAGIHMLARPKPGNRYVQGSAPEIDFLDCATVLNSNLRVCVPVNCYQNVLLVDEISPLDPGPRQFKFHAPDVGIVRIDPVNDPEGEQLVLVENRTLSAAELAAARASALALEARAYQVSEVYGTTEPAE